MSDCCRSVRLRNLPHFKNARPFFVVVERELSTKEEVPCLLFSFRHKSDRAFLRRLCEPNGRYFQPEGIRRTKAQKVYYLLYSACTLYILYMFSYSPRLVLQLFFLFPFRQRLL